MITMIINPMSHSLVFIVRLPNVKLNNSLPKKDLKGRSVEKTTVIVYSLTLAGNIR
jgi:hypothetical protein